MIQNTDVLFETENLCVKKFTPDDANNVYRVLSDAQVMKFVESPFTEKQTETFLENCGLTAPPLVYAVWHKQNKNYVGHLIFHRYDKTDYETGWVLDKNYWGRGYAQELLQATIRYCNANDICGLILECDNRQTQTKHIAQKFGFELISDTPLSVFGLKL